jgi:hypothetical protein
VLPSSPFGHFSRQSSPPLTPNLEKIKGHPKIRNMSLKVHNKMLSEIETRGYPMKNMAFEQEYATMKIVTQ